MNFCTSVFSPKIYCSCVCGDGFQVENLVQNFQQVKKQKYFQAERFVRLPVFVTLQFPFPISLKQINLTPYVGQQCARVVQVSVLHYSRNSHQKFTVDEKDVRCKAGRAVLSSRSPICFHNQSYTFTEDESRELDGVGASTVMVPLHGRLSNIIAIKISIFGMLTGSVASIASLQVWGKPSYACDQHTAQTFTEKWLKVKDDVKTPSSQFDFYGDSFQEQEGLSVSQINDKVDAIKEEEQNNNWNTPQEFLDPLTYDLMRNPVLLPSGYTIDQNTLDKHATAQSEWCRPLSDPFTGIPFTEKYKPVFNAQLKVRIDKYLLHTSNDFQTDSMPSCSRTAPSRASNQVHQQKRLFSEVFGPTSGSCSKTLKSTRQADTEDWAEPVSSGESSNTACSSSVTSYSYKDTSITGSLENALRDVKKRSSNYRPLKFPTSTVSPMHCGKCAVFLTSIMTKYLLPCDHTLCRNCMLFVKDTNSCESEMTCPTCSLTFTHKQVNRTFKLPKNTA